MLDVQAIRRDIPSLQRAIYLNTGGVGPITRRVWELLNGEFTERYLNGSPLNMRPQSLQMEKDRARATMARFLGIKPTEIAFTRGVADGANMVTHGLPWQPGDEVITSDEENPSFLLPVLMLKERGVVVRTLPLDNDGGVILERLHALLSPRTRLVAISHVTSDNGIRLPAQEICRMAHKMGAYVFYDGAQSVGRFPIDLKAMGCDFYGILSYKWLLGPYTAGLLYVPEEHLGTLKVSFSGERADKFIDREAGTFELLDTAQRFEYGPHGWPLYFGMAEAAKYLDELGLEQIAEQADGQSAYLCAALKEIPRVVIGSPQQTDTRTSTVTLGIEGMTGQEIVAALRAKWNIITRPTDSSGGRWAGARFDGVRVSVGFFTTTEELDAVVAAVAVLATAS
jgi:selenocysteine lyase/cysteine desulfurase